MPQYITDPEVKMLATIAETIKSDYLEDPESWHEKHERAGLDGA